MASEQAPELESASVGAGSTPPVLGTNPSRGIVQDTGMTVLWQPTDSTIADLVFVHGLGGHPRKTWQQPIGGTAAEAEGNSKPSKSLWHSLQRRRGKEEHCFWPQDLVPKDFPNVRVMTYGYKSSLHTKGFLGALTDYRDACRNRPLIFVAHSLGGILVKDAIVESNKYRQSQHPEMRDVSNSVSAIVFFGTPHQGSAAARYGDIIATVCSGIPGLPSTERRVLQGLRFDSDKLSGVLEDFNDFLNDDTAASNQLRMLSFQEGTGMSGVTGFDGKVVPDFSSAFYRKDIERIAPLTRDHREMCKFKDTQDPGYVTFRASLGRYLDRITSTTNLRNAIAVEEEDRRQRILEAAAQQQQEGDIRALVEKLDFADRLTREHQIAKDLAEKATFEWVWSSELASWLKSQEQLFWINGSPASGKSTLLHHVVHAPETRKILKQVHGPELTCIYYFFDFRAGKELRNSLEGLMQALLVQLVKSLTQDETNKSQLLETLERLADSESPRIDAVKLRSTFREVLQQARGCVFIAIDGLDEYEGDRFDLVRFIKGHVLAPVDDATTPQIVKVCLASRPEQSFLDAFADRPFLAMQNVNADAIKTYARMVFEDTGLRRYWESSDMLSKVAEKIVEQSNGVFLWARFAACEIAEQLQSGKLDPILKNLVNAIEGMPSDLNRVYTRIVRQACSTDRAFARVMLTYVTSAQNSVFLEMLRGLFALHANDPPPWFEGLDVTCLQNISLGTLQRRLLASTGGLLELYEDRDPRVGGRVAVLHRTVKIFLDNQGWAELAPSLHSTKSIQLAWLTSCCSLIAHYQPYLFFLELGPQRGRWWNPAKLKYPSLPSTIKRDTRSAPQKLSIGAYLLLAYAGYMVDCIQRAAGSFNEGPPGPAIASTRNEASVLLRRVNESPANDALELIRSQVVAFAIEHRTFKALAMLRTVLQYCPVIRDEELGAALRRADAKTVRAMMECNHSDSLVCKIDTRDMSLWEQRAVIFIFRRGLLAEVFHGNVPSTLTVGPLWMIGRRPGHTTASRQQIADLIDIFTGPVYRSINAQCGPFGTILHSYVDCCTGRGDSYDHDFNVQTLQTLVAKGVDVNATGPLGTPLEFLDRIAHSGYYHPGDNSYQRYLDLRKALLDLRAIDSGGLWEPSAEDRERWKKQHLRTRSEDASSDST
ncbi:Protein SERAC1 [Cyphellophora attinorum]|uniref:Protein SERAC1 n=1 Tax=Cyphellophora attinorum TaxID=1664694 RepID=A0A0N0NRV6_9EURO|nr:Protein SERAC1 [Phialophora attinorum]KPI45279.1 Protein SERAC1 [Phialophora attinorum]